VRWYEAEQDSLAAPAIFVTYLGHVHGADTKVTHGSHECDEEAMRALERRWEERHDQHAAGATLERFFTQR